MKATVFLHMEKDGKPPRACVHSLSDGRRFISLDLGDVDIHTADYDRASSTNARSIAAALLTAADELDAAVQREDGCVESWL
jgi:hypothetical protein